MLCRQRATTYATDWISYSVVLRGMARSHIAGDPVGVCDRIGVAVCGLNGGHWHPCGEPHRIAAA